MAVPGHHDVQDWIPAVVPPSPDHEPMGKDAREHILHLSDLSVAFWRASHLSPMIGKTCGEGVSPVPLPKTFLRVLWSPQEAQLLGEISTVKITNG